MEEAAGSVLSGHEMHIAHQSCSRAARSSSHHCSRGLFVCLFVFLIIFWVWIVPSQKQDAEVEMLRVRSKGTSFISPLVARN